MPGFPALDIVSDVARAANPDKVRLAVKRLEDIGGEKTRIENTPFTLATTSSTRASLSAPPRIIDNGAPNGSRSETLTPAQKFEAFLLQSWLESILPKTDGGVYGTEAGAGIWRSMMAEQIASQFARTDIVGLHKLLEHQKSVLPS